MMEYLCHAVLAVMIVHNELDCVKLNTQILFEELKGTGSEIVIVDNCSDDGLSEWLSGQELASYVICDERIEGYGAILRIVTDQFANGRDILLLRANYFLTPRSIILMSAALHSRKEVAAAGPVGSYFPGEQNCFAGTTYEEAISIQESLNSKNVETAYIDMDVMLIKASTVNALEECIEIPQAVMRNYMKHVLRQGFCFMVVKQAVCFALNPTDDEIYRSFDPCRYKQEKLHHLLYSFGDATYKGVHLYKYLEPDILVGINDHNGLQNTKRNAGILMWNEDGVLLSSDEEADRVRELIEGLPQKEVLFVTLPMRREYHGSLVHTAIETFISSLDEEKYLDMEYVFSNDMVEAVPTKNWQPVTKMAIPKIYGVQSVDKQELLEFLWSQFIHPLEETLDIKFADDILAHCLFKASYIMKEREGFLNFYRKVIEKVKPKVIIYSHGQDMALTYLRDTAKELGIPTLEIDHGVGTVDTFHKHLVYADYLIVYSNIVAKKCRELGNDKVIGIGKPGAYAGIPEPQYKYPTIVISFISSLENEIFTYAKNLAARLDRSKYLVVYKMHSAELWSEKEKRRIEETENIQFIDGSLDIRELVGMSDIVVGIRSSGIFDALPFSMVKVIEFKDKADNFSEARPNEIIQEVADNGDIIMVDDEEQLYQEVVSYHRNVRYRAEINSFWPADAEERFRKLVDSYL